MVVNFFVKPMFTMLFAICMLVRTVLLFHVELDKFLPEDMFDVIDDVVTNLMADEANPTKKDEPTVEEIKEPDAEEESDDDDDIPDLE